MAAVRYDYWQSSACDLVRRAPGLAGLSVVPQMDNAARWGNGASALPRITAIPAALSEIPAVQAAPTDPFKPEG